MLINVCHSIKATKFEITLKNSDNAQRSAFYKIRNIYKYCCTKLETRRQL